jgi:hypothetical protein
MTTRITPVALALSTLLGASTLSSFAFGQALFVEWDAPNFNDGTDIWDSTNNTARWIGGTSASLNAGATNFSAVNSWLSTPKFDLRSSSNAGSSFSNVFTTDPTLSDGTFEFAFRPGGGDFSGTHVLFEDGGNGVGMGFAINDAQLRFAVSGSSGGGDALATADLSGLDANDFIHVVGTIDLINGSTPPNLALYVNGGLEDVSAVGENTADWGGDGSPAKIGAVGQNVPDDLLGGANTGDFDGDLAFLRLYSGNEVFDQSEVTAAYNAVAGDVGSAGVPEPASFTLLALLGVALVVRSSRRRKFRV